jgi:hypothetical protein
MEKPSSAFSSWKIRERLAEKESMIDWIRLLMDCDTPERGTGRAGSFQPLETWWYPGSSCSPPGIPDTPTKNTEIHILDGFYYHLYDSFSFYSSQEVLSRERIATFSPQLA